MKITLIIIYCLLLSLLFWGLPNEIINGQGLISWTPFVIIFFILPFILYKTLNLFNISVNRKKLIIPLSMLIIGPLFGFYLGFREHEDLKEFGIKTKGFVYSKWLSLGKNGGWLIRCNYFVDGRKFSTFSENDKFDKYKIGDTLTVLYNSKFPQECIIVELK